MMTFLTGNGKRKQKLVGRYDSILKSLKDYNERYDDLKPYASKSEVEEMVETQKEMIEARKAIAQYKRELSQRDLSMMSTKKVDAYIDQIGWGVDLIINNTVHKIYLTEAVLETLQATMQEEHCWLFSDARDDFKEVI